jgi:predicted acyltransferase
VVILAMLFVNDLTGVKGAPPWMLHAPTLHDGMTFVDLVFPAFLFMVGMSIPLALGRRERPWPHVLSRAASLVFLGFLEVNGDHVVPGRWLSVEGWYLLEGAGILLVWNAAWKPGLARGLRLAGWAMLAACMVLFTGQRGTGPLALRPEWWGILGLIGWGYLAACLVFLPGRGRAWALPAGVAGFLAFALAQQVGWLARLPGMGLMWNPVVSFAPHGAIILAGALLGRMLGRDETPAARLGRVAGYGALLYLASMALHSQAHLGKAFIISKNLGTVPWCLRASAWTVFLFLGIHLVVDRGGWRRGTGFLRDAGNNALFAYMMAPVAVAMVEVLCRTCGHPGLYESLATTFPVGLARAGVHAILLTWLAGVLFRRGVHLKL